MSAPVQKITFAEIRAAGVRSVLVYCADHRCSHSTSLVADRWTDDVRQSDIEPRFTCWTCGHRGADVRPDWITVPPLPKRVPRIDGLGPAISRSDPAARWQRAADAT